MGVVVIVTAKIAFVFDCLHIYSMKVKVTVTPHAGDVYSVMYVFMHEHALCFHAVYVHVLQVEALTVLLISMLHLTGIYSTYTS